MASRSFAAFCVILAVAYIPYRVKNTYENPVLGGTSDNVPDPCVVLDGSEYIATATSTSPGAASAIFRLWHSRNLIDWHADERYPGVPARELIQGQNDFWSPDLLIARPTDANRTKRYFLYYSVRRNNADAPRIMLATAQNLSGPYQASGKVIVEEANDPMVFENSDGKKILFWVRDDFQSGPRAIRAGQLSDDGSSLLTETVATVIENRGEDVHNPFAIEMLHRYYLFFSTGRSTGETCNYTISVAISGKVMSSYAAPNIVVPDSGEWACFGMGSIVPARQTWYVAYHAYRRQGGGMDQRKMLLDEVRFSANAATLVRGAPSAHAPSPFSRESDRLKTALFWEREIAMLLLSGVFGFVPSRMLRIAEAKREERRLAAERQLELDQARREIDELLPGKPPVAPGVEVAYCRREAASISGDFYQHRVLPDGRIAIWLVDVEGHGAAAATNAVMLDTALAQLWAHGSPKEQLERADLVLSHDRRFTESGRRYCMNLTHVSAVDMRVDHANAGMPTMLLYRDGDIDKCNAWGFFVGEGYSNLPHERVYRELIEGDLLVLVSDGVMYAAAPDGSVFHEHSLSEALISLATRPAEQIASGLVTAAASFARLQQPKDDQTVVVIRVRRPAPIERHDNTFVLRKVADVLTAADTELWPFLTDLASTQGFGGDRILEVWSAVWECILNAMRHGTDPDSFILLTIDRGIGFIKVCVRQFGTWSPQPISVELDHRPKLDRGSDVIRHLADRVEISPDGLKMELEFGPDVKN